MKKLISMFVVAGLISGCASTATKEQEGVKVEDRAPVVVQQPTPATKPQPQPSREASATPVPTQTVGADPLKDPGNILSRRTVFFDYDSNVVKEEFRPLVAAHAKYISGNRQQRMTIQGNTDERGSREYNLALGQRRAEAVKQMMTLLGAQSSQIETVSFGEEKPRTQGNNEQAYAENRRADIVYQGE
jgi:peptidoglycan-associated lipoprotein